MTRINTFCLFLLITLIISSCGANIVDGYTDKISYSSSDTVSVFLNSNKRKEDYPLIVSNISGEVVFKKNISVSPQKAPPSGSYMDGFNYDVTTQIPLNNFKSGIYLIDNKTPFIVKPSVRKKILILYDSNTENAYTNSGGKSMYAYNSSEGKPTIVASFQRPMVLSYHSREFLKWASTLEYDIGFICDQDLEDYKNIEHSDLLIIPGHSEYWTRKARENFDRFIDEGNNSLILSGNSMWWQIRYDSTNTKMICYKYNQSDTVKNPLLKTINWTEEKLNYDVIKSIGLDFEHGGYGKKGNVGWRGYKITASKAEIFKGTGIYPGDIISLPSDEYDGTYLSLRKDSSVHLNNKLGFYRYELIGYDWASKANETRTKHFNGSWIIMQKDSTSGTIINVGSTDWCSEIGMNGKSSSLIKKITTNMIKILLD